MILRICSFLFALCVGLAAPAMAQSVQEFSLPAATPTSTPSPQAQGPVDTESGVLPVVPRVIETATPTPTPQPTGTQASENAVTEQAGGLTPEEQASASPTVRSDQRPSALASTSADTQPALDTAADVQNSDGVTAPPPAQTQSELQSPDSGTTQLEPTNSFAWWWIAAIVGFATLLALAVIARRMLNARSKPPVIERPVVPQTGPARQAIPANPLTIRLNVEKLTRSAVFATLRYSITLVNRSDQALSDVTLATDLVSASSAVPMEQQIATRTMALEPRHKLHRIAPNQNLTVQGQVQLALSDAKVIRQGQHPLLVPLLRVRVDGVGDAPILKTFVIGQGQADGGRVQPFRLDEPPRSYAPVAQREIA